MLSIGSSAPVVRAIRSAAVSALTCTVNRARYGLGSIPKHDRMH